MKLVCLLLCLYALALSLNPCADGSCGGDQQHIASSQHEDEQENDLCSSFCTCSCCGYMATESSAATNLLITSRPTAIRYESFYDAPFVKGFCVDFWQPPKLG